MVRIDRIDEELDPRCRDVLREIVIQYTTSGEPISSRTLAKLGRFGLSPASLRNAMADLEDMGFVYQPHTSAGRVPTDRGYRFFINNLMRSRRISNQEQEIIDEQVSQVNDLDDVMQIASKLTAKMSDQVGIVFMPTLQHLVMRSLTLIPVSDGKAMVVVVATNGVVVNRIIDVPGTFGAEELEQIGRYITGEFGGLSLSVVRERLSAMMQQERAQQDAKLRRTITVGIEAVDDVLPVDHELYVEGAASILNKPEYSDAESLRKTMSAFEEKERLVEILTRCLTEEGVQILIGSESQFTRSYNFSLVAARYGSEQSPSGLVGVIGPTRMEYARMATLVEYIGRALTRKIEETRQEQSS
jgi:heat-inducible transcriptional repressor